jgi:predicted RNA-binding Zn-ribbon protein involved in translation (DUF1610 family)
MGQPPRYVGSQTLENKALSRGIIRKAACILIEITIRKSQSIPASEQAKAKKSSKVKFTCPDCGQNAWAKPGALLICGECFDEGEGDICFMLAEQ